LKKLFFGLIVFLLIQSQYLFSFDIDTASKIYDKLFYAVFKKEDIKVYVNDDEYKKIILSSQYLKLTQEIENSDIIIITKVEDINKIKNKIAFSIEKEFLDQNENIIGAFYWNKGNPEIIFIKNRLEKHNLNLLESFKKYEK
jgi:hypothetical protein